MPSAAIWRLQPPRSPCVRAGVIVFNVKQVPSFEQLETAAPFDHQRTRAANQGAHHNESLQRQGAGGVARWLAIGVERDRAVASAAHSWLMSRSVLHRYQHSVATSTAQPVQASERPAAAHHDNVDGLHCQQLEARGLVDALVHQAGEGHTYCGTGERCMQTSGAWVACAGDQSMHNAQAVGGCACCNLTSASKAVLTWEVGDASDQADDRSEEGLQQ